VSGQRFSGTVGGPGGKIRKPFFRHPGGSLRGDPGTPPLPGGFGGTSGHGKLGGGVAQRAQGAKIWRFFILAVSVPGGGGAFSPQGKGGSARFRGVPGRGQASPRAAAGLGQRGGGQPFFAGFFGVSGFLFGKGGGGETPPLGKSPAEGGCGGARPICPGSQKPPPQLCPGPRQSPDQGLWARPPIADGGTGMGNSKLLKTPLSPKGRGGVAGGRLHGGQGGGGTTRGVDAFCPGGGPPTRGEATRKGLLEKKNSLMVPRTEPGRWGGKAKKFVPRSTRGQGAGGKRRGGGRGVC